MGIGGGRTKEGMEYFAADAMDMERWKHCGIAFLLAIQRGVWNITNWDASQSG